MSSGSAIVSGVWLSWLRPAAMPSQLDARINQRLEHFEQQALECGTLLCGPLICRLFTLGSLSGMCGPLIGGKLGPVGELHFDAQRRDRRA
jgi:hypothetical protein